MLDIGVSAAAYETQQEEAQQTLQEASLASAYASFAASEAWTDIKQGLDQMVNETEAAILDGQPGDSVEKQRDTLVEHRAWKKIRVFLETRVTEKSQEFAAQTPQES